MSDEISELKEREKKAGQELPQQPHEVFRNGRTARRVYRHRAQRPSLFGPILLIGTGFYFLLTNLNIIDGSLHWEALFRLWPVFLIFLGVNIIARQLPGVLGTLASGLVGLTAVALAGTVLFFADRLPYVNQLVPTTGPLTRATIAQPLGEAATASITIEATSLPLTIGELVDSNQLVEGEISYAGDLIEVYEPNGELAAYRLDTRHTGLFASRFVEEDDRWDLRLTSRIPLDLNLDLKSGPSDLNFERLQLIELILDGGSGPLFLGLPAGSYQGSLDLGSGPSRLVLPEKGVVKLVIDGGSGPIHIVLPPGMPMRVQIEKGSGPVSADERFILVDGQPSGDGIWETRSFSENAPDRVEIELDVGSGPVSITGFE